MIENSPPALKRLLEALLFASSEPVSERVLEEHLPPGCRAAPLLAELTRDYAPRGVHLVKRGEGWAFRTAPDLAEHLKIETDVPRKLSRAAVETLAIIAYHQPVTRAEIEEMRGVALSKGTLDILFEAGWVRPGTRRRTPGRPLTWVTTNAFLDHFGLRSLDELPGVEDLKAAGLLDVRQGLTSYAASAHDEGPPLDTEEEEPPPLDPLGDDLFSGKAGE